MDLIVVLLYHLIASIVEKNPVVGSVVLVLMTSLLDHPNQRFVDMATVVHHGYMDMDYKQSEHCDQELEILQLQ